MKVNSNQYHVISKAIHWITALIIAGLLFLGHYMTSLDFSEDKLALYAWHKSFGLLILLLVLVRVFLHIVIRKPKPLSTYTTPEKILARLAHLFLYLALIVIPLSGWIMSSAGDFAIQFFGIDVPDITNKDEAVFKLSREVHEILALVLTFVVGLHILGALKHHFIDGDITLKRMTSYRVGLLGGIVLTVLFSAMFAPAFYYAANTFVQKIIVEKSANTNETQRALKITEQETMENSKDGLWEIIKEESSIKFQAQQYGQPFEGEFKNFKGTINFDPEGLEGSSVNVTVDISSIRTGSEDRDEQALSEDWFNEDKYPKAKFTADNFIKEANGDYVAKGQLALRGNKVPLDLPFSLEIKDSIATMDAQISLNRLNFGIGQGQWKNTDAIGKKVDVIIKVKARRH